MNLHTLKSIRLLRWLPLSLAAVYLVSAVLMLLFQYTTTLEHLHEDAENEVRETLHELGQALRGDLEEQRFDRTRSALSRASLTTEVELVALYDDQGLIVDASRYGLRGRPAGELLPKEALRPQGVDRTRSGIRVTRGTRETELLGFYPITLSAPQKGLRESRVFHLVLVYDYGWQREVHLRESLESSAFLLLMGLLITLALYFVLRRYVAHPLHQLARFANQMAEDPSVIRISYSGPGELAGLARALNEMSERVASALEQTRASERNLSTTLDAIGDGVIATDSRGLVARMNPQAAALTGWPLSDALARPLVEVLHVVDGRTGEAVSHSLAQGLGGTESGDLELVTRDGRRLRISETTAPIPGNGEGPHGIVVVFRDVTEQHALQRRAFEAQALFKAFTRTLPDLAFILDWQGVYLEVFGAQEQLLFAPREQVIGRSTEDILPAETHEIILGTIRKTLESGLPQVVEYELQVPAGLRVFEGRTAALEAEAGPPTAVTLLVRDVTDRRTAMQRIEQLALYDALTSLPNRRTFMDRLDQEIARSRRRERFGAVLYLDLDQFKVVNDSLGHHVGDELLVSVADRLRSAIRAEDLPARLGGDEFVVLLPDLGRDEARVSGQALAVAQKISAALYTAFPMAGNEIYVTTSIGVAIYPRQDIDANGILKQADIAMYRAKTDGRNTVRFFSRGMQRGVEQRLSMQSALRRALETDAFRLLFQPIVSAGHGIVGAEVLLRWIDKQGETRLPTEFLQLAEETGLIERIGEKVLDQACREVRRLRAAIEADADCPISVNISPGQLRSPRFVKLVRESLAAHDLPGSALMLEITEDSLLGNHEDQAAKLQALREDGIRFAIDGFGTGYSSLGQLKHLPVDRVKINACFVRDLVEDPKDTSIVEAIIAMADRLGLETVAAGVETVAQRDFLKARGCSLFQGYLFAEPMPADALLALIRSDRGTGQRCLAAAHSSSPSPDGNRS